MVDAISGGRFEIGFARAYMPYEFAAFGVPIDESRKRFTATIDAVLCLWRETDVTIEAPFFTLCQATSLPRPPQIPHPSSVGCCLAFSRELRVDRTATIQLDGDERRE
jgi:alkanesulfonate monooxygenase SsuD/methylene tetrahydromethanopterin reductase-like flavin-dependent oxidoreductase (luciferase family)